jgi:Animal haem peroxidase
MPCPHSFGQRIGDLQPPGDNVQSGKYGRMFPELPAFRPKSDALVALGNAMFDTKREDESGDNNKIPSGYTYLGQFIDHDITFDPTSIEEALVDPLALINFRTPKLDLDCIYGGGPFVHPYLYQRSTQGQAITKFEIGKTKETPTLNPFPNDLPRSSTGFALISDPRNDGNLIVAQLHLAFLKFHNRVVEELEKGTISPEYGYLPGQEFEIARKIVIWHYQWLILYDFLPRIISKLQLNIVKKEISFYKYNQEPFIPIEFSAAAFRFGHTMIRSEYNYNRKFSPPDGSAPSLKQLFKFTGAFSSDNVPVFSNWIIDWRRFFEIDKKIKPNFSRKIDPFLSKALLDLSAENLAIKDLKRGSMLGLPSGQRVAKFMGMQALRPDEISTDSDGEIAKEHGFHIETPLWYYLLKEAQIQQEGKRLGEVGSRILAEVFVGLLMGDSNSFIVQDKNWRPTLPAKVPGQFTMVDMLNFVNEINPIGGEDKLKTN